VTGSGRWPPSLSIDPMPQRPGKRRPGRRPGESGTRQAILAAARGRFAEHGWDRTTIRAIAGDADDASRRERGRRGCDLPVRARFYGAVSQLLPPGAALTAVRNVHYVDWAATLTPLLVLGAWAAGGLVLGLLGERYGPHVRNAPA
jgi:hypothetical protein